MPEAEVSLRLAIYLISSGRTEGTVSVAIDGAQVRLGEKVHFSVRDFLREHGWDCDSTDRWQATYHNNALSGVIDVHSRPGIGDVCTMLLDGSHFVAEAKKGPILRSKSSAEYPLLREALGQLLTIETLPKNPTLAVAVPHSQKFAQLATRWRSAPLVQLAGIRILTVGQDGNVHGWQQA
jgi:hypothetical protein